MALEIWSETDRIFCHFGPFFTLSSLLIIPKIKILKKKWNKCLEISSSDVYMCTINEDHTIYGSWNIRRDRQKLLSFWALFCPLTIWTIKILTLKKHLDTLLFYIFAPYNHMMYGSWDMEHDRENFLSFWTIFCPFAPL